MFKSRWLATAVIVLSCLLSQPLKAMDESTDNITFVDMDGNETQLSDYQGKWVIVNLWATWCPPCLVEIPDLVLFHEAHHKDKAIVLGVNLETISAESVKQFSEDQFINYPVVRFKAPFSNSHTPLGPLRGLPTTYMITPKGKVVAVRTGLVDDAMLERFINKYESMSEE